MSLRRKPTRVGEAVYVGAVWTNGEPILIAEAAAAEAWRGSERFDDALAALEERRDTAPIDGAVYALGLEVGEGTLDVFVLGDGRALMIGLLYASGDDWPAFVGSALAAGHASVGALDVRAGRLVLLSSAADWDDLRKVAAKPRAAPKRRQPAEDALLLECPAGSHDLGYAYVEQADFALQTWLLSARHMF